MTGDMNLSQKTGRMAERTSEWFAANSVDLLLATGAALLIAALLLGLRAFGHRLVRDRSDDLHWRTIVGRVLSRTSLVFIILCAVEIVAENAGTPPAALRVINILFTIAAAIQAAVWARELVLGLILHRIGDADQHSALGTAVGLIRGLVTAALFAIALVLILDNLGVNVTGLVAGLGIGGIAIGLAAQGIFKDLFAAVAIILDRPFRRGDAIKFDQVNGSIEQIGLKSTRIRSVDGEEIVASNAILLDKIVHNFAHVGQRRLLLKFGLVQQTSPEDAARVPDLVRQVAARHDLVELVRAGITGISPYALDFEAEMRVQTPDYDYFFAARSAIFLELLAGLRREGIRLAYPTQTSFTAAPDGSYVLPYESHPLPRD
ncbi:MAG: Potassium efflux system KefA protein / Small-conductance mechanosensitive channel [uncultured Sphingosinicella sp.]|uniref:Potassium efflux system KefA protein / Small-conductance mechanosensitive channel n=1 Tax=uncultured Sphingosinicella sp. TaxID=478748 RepID=A0A6J4TF84_9SPHN|nr:mechanosensitive ion channel domain-containing protein [uncultured Sphingosinicella sp.]CAA9520464.1 MAG: Potassium efflux system KefA protein / Small-conductance mechanosensitive channel [uncultured Sphingosinicella sp.]